MPPLNVGRSDASCNSLILLTRTHLNKTLENPRHGPPATITGLVHNVIYSRPEPKLLPELVYDEIYVSLLGSHLGLGQVRAVSSHTRLLQGTQISDGGCFCKFTHRLVDF